MGTVQPGIESIKLLGKDHHITVVRLRDERDPFHLTEVLSFCQGDPHTISRVSAVGNDVLPFYLRYARILHPKLLIGCEWAVLLGNQKGFRIDGKVEAVVTACQTNDGPARAEMRTEKHDVLVPVLHHRGVVNRFDGIRDLCFSEDRILVISSDDVRLHDRLFASISKIVW